MMLWRNEEDSHVKIVDTPSFDSIFRSSDSSKPQTSRLIILCPSPIPTPTRTFISFFRWGRFLDRKLRQGTLSLSCLLLLIVGNLSIYLIGWIFDCYRFPFIVWISLLYVEPLSSSCLNYMTCVRLGVIELTLTITCYHVLNFFLLFRGVEKI